MMKCRTLTCDLSRRRFTDNEVANTLGVRFYCGAPLLGSGGARLGTLCFVDSKPRQFAAEQLLILANL